MVRAWTFRAPSSRLSLTHGLAAAAAGVGLTWLACWLLPWWSPGSPGYGGAVWIGAGAAGLLIGLSSLLPLLERERTMDGVLIVGRGDLAAKLCLDLLHHQHAERFAGQVEVEQLGGGGGASFDCRCLKQLVSSHRISRIVVAEPNAAARSEITSALLECRLLGLVVEDAADFYQRLHGKLWLEAVDPGRLVFSRGFRITPVYLGFKRMLDVICALTLLLLTSPLIAVIALAVKLESPGPVLFRQERVGWFGKRFTIFKFRSMCCDAESASGPVWARQNDQRITRIGRVLRRFHLDEIPQALNVLRGDLSFVGPRPERPCFVEVLERSLPFYDLRHYVKPGITGWAQVRYPYANTIAESYEKLQYDLYYAKHVSWALDLEILLRTALVLVRGGGQ